MHGPDSDPQGQDVASALMAVDATLAGDPVDPDYAELAELALILRRERPRTSDAFTARLDQQVQRRFARPAPAVRGAGLRRWVFNSLAGLAAAGAATALVIVIANGGGGVGSNGAGVSLGSAGASSSSAAASAAPRPAVASSSAAAGGTTAGGAAGQAVVASSGTQKLTPDARRLSSAGKHAAATPTNESSSSGSSAAAQAAPPGSVIPTPVIPGKRQVVQSAQLMLSVSSGRIDDVSQQVFNVVGQEKGYVNSSNVTSGAGGNAYFQLSVPSANLAATLAALSQLKSAHVLSRSDNTNDITGQVGGAGQRLAEARALRSSLLKQLANAVTTEQVNSIQARLHDANASIASDLSTLRGLQRQVAYSNITLRIEPVTKPAPVTHHHSSGFTIGGAAHDASRVLVVAAGVALIVLAVLVPLGLVVALLAWVGFAIRRRRRDQALDLV